MLATVALLGAGCSEQGGSGSSKLIEKPQVTVENGQFTPEVLNAFGRVSDAQVSPDGKKILYGITYVSVAENTADEARDNGDDGTKKTKSADKADNNDDGDNDGSEGGMKGWVIALIVIAGVVVLISVEVFIFEMVKLNNTTKK